MRGRLAVLGLVCTGVAFGQGGFVWDYNGYGPYGSYTGGWALNGDTTFASSSGGSILWPNTISGSNPNDFELNTTIYPNGGSGTFMHFLHASSSAVLPGTGS